MSIAEKLLTIAENEQRVFEAGEVKGEAEGTLETAKLCMGKLYPVRYRVPDGVERLALYAFSGASNLFYLNLPPSLNFVANSVFNGCSALTEVVFEGGKLTAFGSGEFQNCTSLKRVYFNCTFTQTSRIPSGTFTSCTKLEEVTFAEPELTGNMYFNPSAVFKKQCAYEIMRKMKDQTGTDKEFAYTVKFHNTVWNNIEDTSAEDYEAPPQHDTWNTYINAKGYNT